MTGWEHVELDPKFRTLRFDRPDLEMDLGAVGKGYALDRVAVELSAHGVSAAFLSAGQSTYLAVGAPPGEAGWPVHVPVPFDRARQLTTVSLHNQALSTSGNYEKFFELDGQRYCHILDPRTGHPVKGMLQTTVLAALAETSDVLSTTIFVLGPIEGRKLLHEHPGTAAIMITETTVDETGVIAVNWPTKISPWDSIRD
jgi:thiamine biosynthesis lipoprotein